MLRFVKLIVAVLLAGILPATGVAKAQHALGIDMSSQSVCTCCVLRGGYPPQIMLPSVNDTRRFVTDFGLSTRPAVPDDNSIANMLERGAINGDVRVPPATSSGVGSVVMQQSPLYGFPQSKFEGNLMSGRIDERHIEHGQEISSCTPTGFCPYWCRFSPSLCNVCQ